MFRNWEKIRYFFLKIVFSPTKTKSFDLLNRQIPTEAADHFSSLDIVLSRLSFAVYAFTSTIYIINNRDVKVYLFKKFWDVYKDICLSLTHSTTNTEETCLQDFKAFSSKFLENRKEILMYATASNLQHISVLPSVILSTL